MMSRFQGIGMTSQRTRERMILRLKEQGIEHPDVLQAMKNTPRHIFVDDALASRAYEDTALPIGHNQTISQPYIVAKMTELLLEVNPHPDKVLEIGTGSGYQTAILAQLSGKVFSLERILPLQKKAKKHLQEDIKRFNIRYLHSDGSKGWAEHAPFDAMLVAAAPMSIPEILLNQLSSNGVMVIPIGHDRSQQLQRIRKTAGGYETEMIEPVMFVPFLNGRS